jgi:hypothetical protein
VLCESMLAESIRYKIRQRVASRLIAFAQKKSATVGANAFRKPFAHTAAAPSGTVHPYAICF